MEIKTKKPLYREIIKGLHWNNDVFNGSQSHVICLAK